MPSAISSYYRTNASYGVVQSSSGAGSDVPSTTPPDGDTVEISQTDASSGGTTSSGTTTSPAASPTYRPPTLEDRFRFDISNGMFDGGLRFNPLASQFNDVAVTTYASRQDLADQVTQTAGSGSAYSALFNLQYQDATPDPAAAGSRMEARSGFNRMIDQNLALLKSL